MVKKNLKHKKHLSKTGKLIIFACFLCFFIIVVLLIGFIKNHYISNTDDINNNDHSLYDITSYDSYSVIVNNNNPLSADYVPSDLVNFSETVLLRQKVVDSLNKLVFDAQNSNINIEVSVGYRSYNDQEVYFDNSINSIGETKSILNGYKPGLNEHQTGLAVDFSTDSDIDWLSKNAYKYGFILRYPENKQNITGVFSNNYHYRYVGISLAKSIYTVSDTETMEEFFDK